MHSARSPCHASEESAMPVSLSDDELRIVMDCAQPLRRRIAMPSCAMSPPSLRSIPSLVRAPFTGWSARRNAAFRSAESQRRQRHAALVALMPLTTRRVAMPTGRHGTVTGFSFWFAGRSYGPPGAGLFRPSVAGFENRSGLVCCRHFRGRRGARQMIPFRVWPRSIALCAGRRRGNAPTPRASLLTPRREKSSGHAPRSG